MFWLQLACRFKDVGLHAGIAASQYCNIHITGLHHQGKLDIPHPPMFLINLEGVAFLFLVILNHQAFVLSAAS